jgi:hypothetical protein
MDVSIPPRFWMLGMEKRKRPFFFWNGLLTSTRFKLRTETVKSAPDGIRQLIFEPEVRSSLIEDSKIGFLAADGVLSAERSGFCRRLITS